MQIHRNKILTRHENNPIIGHTETKGKNMKKTLLIALPVAMIASSANAGLLDSLIGKEKEPQTLEEACNTDEIKSICPEILLSDMTVTECLMKNINALSTKCAGYVKKAATEKIDAVKQQVADAQNNDTKSETAEKIEQAKANLDAKKAEVAATAQEVKDTTKSTADSLKETGTGLMNLFKK